MRLLLISIIFLQTALCQYIFNDIKLVLGYNRASLSLNESLPEEDFGNINHYYNGNLNFGVSSEIYPSYHVGLLYTQRGTRETQNIFDTIYYEDGDQAYIDVEAENIHILKYLSITGHKYIHLSDQFFILGGVNVDVYLGGEIKVKEDVYIEYYYNDSGYTYYETDTIEETLDFYDMYLKEPNPVDFGAQIGIGFNLIENISAVAMYQYGILEAHEISYEGTDYKNGWKNRGLQFQLSIDVLNILKSK